MSNLINGGAAAAPTTVADYLPSAGIDFGYCGIHQTATRSLVLANPYFTGLVKFDIVADNCPFTISTLSGKRGDCFILKEELHIFMCFLIYFI